MALRRPSLFEMRWEKNHQGNPTYRLPAGRPGPRPRRGILPFRPGAGRASPSFPSAVPGQGARGEASVRAPRRWPAEPAQVEMYLAVQRRAWTLVEGDRAGTPSAADANDEPAGGPGPCRCRATGGRAPGLRPGGYRWVRDRVAEASVLPSAGCASTGWPPSPCRRGPREPPWTFVRGAGSSEGPESGAPATETRRPWEWNRKLLEAVSGRAPRS